MLLGALIALLAGPGHRQGVGALQAAGRPLGRSPPRPRVPALHARPELPRRQPDRSGDRGAGQGRAGRRRSAGDSPDPRQPVSREGAGRPGDPGAPGAAAAGPTSASSSTRTCCSASGSTTSAAASSTARSRRSPKCCASIPTTSTRCRTSRSCTRSSISGPTRTRRVRSWPRGPSKPRRPGITRPSATWRTRSASRR